MAACNVNDLMTRASAFMGLTPGQRQAVIVELLCQIKGGDCTPATLLEQAAQFGGLTPGQLQAVQAQLLCQWRG